MTKLLTEQELREALRQATHRVRVRSMRDASINGHHITEIELAALNLIQSQKLAHVDNLERIWYVVDKDTIDENGTIVIGPFTTSADAAVAREYIERKDPRDRNYWLEQRERNKQ